MSAMPFRSKSKTKNDTRGQDPIDLLTEPELLSWISAHTEWADDYDPETQSKEILAIYDLEQHEDQLWKVTTKRRREQSGVQVLETVEILKLNQFPSIKHLEVLMQAEGYGGGVFTITNTHGKKRNQRIELDSEPEDPLSRPVQAEEPVFKDRFRSMIEDAGLRYLRENPYDLNVVAIRWLEKELGIKIPLPARPDPNAQIPFADLPAETREWLEEHPEDRDNYIRREIGLERPEPRETAEDRMVKALEKRLLSDIASGIGSRPSQLSTVLGGLLEGTDPAELISQIADTFPGVIGKLTGLMKSVQSQNEGDGSGPPRRGQSSDQPGGS